MGLGKGNVVSNYGTLVEQEGIRIPLTPTVKPHWPFTDFYFRGRNFTQMLAGSSIVVSPPGHQTPAQQPKSQAWTYPANFQPKLFILTSSVNSISESD